jgi:hypothetical protein
LERCGAAACGIDAIRALGKLPAATDVLDAWMKSDSYGEPIETLQSALAWLGEFVAKMVLRSEV